MEADQQLIDHAVAVVAASRKRRRGERGPPDPEEEKPAFLSENGRQACPGVKRRFVLGESEATVATRAGKRVRGRRGAGSRGELTDLARARSASPSRRSGRRSPATPATHGPGRGPSTSGRGRRERINPRRSCRPGLASERATPTPRFGRSRGACPPATSLEAGRPSQVAACSMGRPKPATDTTRQFQDPERGPACNAAPGPGRRRRRRHRAIRGLESSPVPTAHRPSRVGFVSCAAPAPPRQFLLAGPWADGNHWVHPRGS